MSKAGPMVFIDEQGNAQVIEGDGEAIKALFAAMPTPPVGRKILALVPASILSSQEEEIEGLRAALATLRASAVASGPAWVVESIDALLGKGSKR